MHGVAGVQNGIHLESGSTCPDAIIELVLIIAVYGSHGDVISSKVNDRPDKYHPTSVEKRQKATRPVDGC